MQRYLSLVLLVFGLALFGGCDNDDVGKRCAPKENDTIPIEPVGGERPTSEIVAVQRNGTCESFQCLTYRGYPSYCTRNCKYDSETQENDCAKDEECKQPLHCFSGKCQDDDCPDGFECRAVQDVGPLANQLFCVQKEGCKNDFDCESVGHVDCKKNACFDSNFLDPDKTSRSGVSPIDGSGTLTCVAWDAVDEFCFCEGGGDECFLPQHPTCDPTADHRVNGVPVGTDAWPDTAVELRGVCMRRL